MMASKVFRQSHGMCRAMLAGTCALLQVGTLFPSAVIAEENRVAVVPNDALRVLRTGDELYIRGHFGAEHDVLIHVGKGRNRQINFRSGRLVPRDAAMTPEAMSAGVLFHGCGDDSTPWNLNGTYIGANHGCSDMREALCMGHGRTPRDLGTEWADARDRRYYLLRIVDADRLWFLGENLSTDTVWSFTRQKPESPLIRPSDGVRIEFTDWKMEQLRPACRITRQEYLIEGKTPLLDGMVVTCSWLDVVEEYDVVSPASVLADAMAHAGQERDFVAAHLDGVVSNHIVYQFQPGGTVVIDYHAEALQQFRLGYMGYIQTARLHRGEYATHEYYMPKTVPFLQDGIRYDFEGIQDYSFKLPSPLTFRASDGNMVADATNPPERFIQFLAQKVQGQTVRRIGYACGYSLLRGMTKPEERVANSGTAIVLYTSSKSYPRAVDAKMGPMIPAGTTFHCVAFRNYFNPALYADATCVHWHREADGIVVYLDYHRSVDRAVVNLPAAWAGKPVMVIEKTPSVTIHSGGTVPATGLVVSVAGGYGRAVLKIAPKP